MAEERRPNFGGFIYEARQAKRWSLREAAKATGIAYTRLDELEKGLNWHTGKSILPTMEQVVRLADAYGCAVDQMLELAGYEPLHRLDTHERELLKLYRTLTPEEQVLMRQGSKVHYVPKS